MSLVRCGMMFALDPSPWSVRDHLTPLHGVSQHLPLRARRSSTSCASLGNCTCIQSFESKWRTVRQASDWRRHSTPPRRCVQDGSPATLYSSQLRADIPSSSAANAIRADRQYNFLRVGSSEDFPRRLFHPRTDPTSDNDDSFCPTPDPISTNRCRKGQVLLCGAPRYDPRVALSDTKAKKASAKTPAVRTPRDDGGIKGADRDEDGQNVKCPSASSASLPKPTALCQFVPR